MATPEDTSQAPEGGAAAGGWRARWKKPRVWVGTVLTSAVVIPLVAWGVVKWAEDMRISNEPHLSKAVRIPSPSRICGGGAGWVFNKDLRQLPAPPIHAEEGDRDKWAAENGGIPASGNYIEVTLQGLHGHTVLVNSISVDIASRTEPPHGTLSHLTNTGGCGGLVPYRFSLNLDASPISVTAETDQGAIGAGEVHRPVNLPHTITGAEPEVWHLAAVTETCTCEWTATLHWTSDDGKEDTTKIDDNGHPFRVAAVTHATRVEPSLTGGGWG